MDCGISENAVYSHAYCPGCHKIISSRTNDLHCSHCGVPAGKITLSDIANISDSLEDRMKLRHYFWNPAYTERFTHFILRHQHHELFCCPPHITYTRLDDKNKKTGSLTVPISESDWSRLFTFLLSLDFSKWITSRNLADKLYGAELDLSDFVGFGSFPPHYTFCYSKDQQAEYPEDFAELFDFVMQLFRHSDLYCTLEKHGAVIGEEILLPYVSISIQNNDTGEIYHKEIPFASKLIVGNTTNAMISANTPSFVLYHKKDGFHIGGGRPRDKQIWSGDTWVIGNTVKKGAIFSFMKKEFTLIDYQVILKPQMYHGQLYPSMQYFE